MTSTENHPWTLRLAQVETRTPLETEIMALVSRIEHMGGHPLLTEAQSLVWKALCTMGAWHDAGEPGGVKQAADALEARKDQP